MDKKTVFWHGAEFVTLSAEGKAGASAAEQTDDLFRRFEAELKAAGLSLEHTVRTRLWARDRENRSQASNARTKVLAGAARASSASFIAPGRFTSDATVALDLAAMRPVRPDAQRVHVEFDPPMTPLRYLGWGPWVFLSGVTGLASGSSSLDDQVDYVLGNIAEALEDAKTSWGQVVKISAFSDRSAKVEDVRKALSRTVTAPVPLVEYTSVDGFAGEGNLIEIEVTATRPSG